MVHSNGMKTESEKWSKEEALADESVDAELHLILTHVDRVRGAGEPENPGAVAVHIRWRARAWKIPFHADASGTPQRAVHSLLFKLQLWQ
jgi:hypothetical protein